MLGTNQSSTGEITSLKSEAFKEVFQLSECVGGGLDITWNPMHVELKSNGTLRVEKAVWITPIGAGCEIEVPPQTIAVEYSNLAGGKLQISINVFNLTFLGAGGLCGAEQKEDDWNGRLSTTLAGGTLKWE